MFCYVLLDFSFTILDVPIWSKEDSIENGGTVVVEVVVNIVVGGPYSSGGKTFSYLYVFFNP